MEKSWSDCRLGSLEKMRTAKMPIELYWMRTISRADVSLYQTQLEHQHSFFELHFVLSGSMEYRYDGRSVRVSAEQMLLLPPEEPHRITYYSEDFLKCTVAFSLDRGEELYAALCAKSGQGIPLSAITRETLLFCAAEAEKDTFYSPIVVQGRIFEILYEISGIREKRRKRSKEENGDIRLAKAKQFIADNMQTFLGCEDVAGYCYLSVKQLNRIFLKYERITLLTYIHREKLRAAETMLKEGERSVQEISEILGFSSVYYFSAFFTKHIGLTPRQYRTEVCGADG